MKIKYYIVAFASLLLSGCGDFLDLTPISEDASDIGVRSKKSLHPLSSKDAKATI